MSKKPPVPSVTLKVRPARGFDCRCRVCGAEARAYRERAWAGFDKVVIFCPKCQDNEVKL